jgi:hypothetical protein
MYRTPDEEERILAAIRNAVSAEADKIAKAKKKSTEEIMLEKDKSENRHILAAVLVFTMLLFGTCITGTIVNPDPVQDPKVQAFQEMMSRVSYQELSCKFSCEPYGVRKVTRDTCECSQTLLAEDQQVFLRTLHSIQE